MFRDYVRLMPLASSLLEKMRLIDRLIRECHRDTRRGTTGRQVAKNLIEGSSRTIRDLLEALAYGNSPHL